jgi:hypothetical protein
MRFRAFALSAVVSTVIGSASILATTVDPPTLRQMVDRADRIFVGEVTNVRSYRTGTSIHTDVTFRTSETVKGAPSQMVLLTFLGGTVGEDTLSVAGMPRFVPGEEQVVFSLPGERHVSPIVGLWHGRVRVSRDPRTRVARVLRNDGTPFETAAAVSARPTLVSPTLVMPMRLDAFLNDVRQLLREGAAR